MTIERRKIAPITDRSQLLSLLTQACELEHGLACSYLYAAFTLKQDLSEGGLTSKQLQKVRFWAAQVFFVAAEEMLHLAQVWNLQAAIGGTPYYLRPNFPLPTNYYPLNLPIVLERFSLQALDRFIQYERPKDFELQAESPLFGPEERMFTTVGELYGLIDDAFQRIPEKMLFIGYEDRQVGPELVDFPNIVKVTNRESARAAIRVITEQGEGVPSDRDDCHFGMFRRVRREYLRALTDAEEAGELYAPVRPSLNNPATGSLPGAMAAGANRITNGDTLRVAEIFDSLYALMLRALQYVFDNATEDSDVLRRLSRLALELMTTTIKPLGESLTMLSAGAEYDAHTAGPSFTLSRHVPLPRHPDAAAVIVTERLADLSSRLAAIAVTLTRPPQLTGAARALAETAARFGS